MAEHPDKRLLTRLRDLGEVFRPAVPVDHTDLFAGRMNELATLATVVAQPGRHAVIFGERGVGKTSLASVSAVLTPTLNLKVNADQSDTFHSIWTKVIDELTAYTFSKRWFWGEEGKEIAQRAIELLDYDEHSPDRVRHFLRILSEITPVAVFIDEFDRVADPGTATLFADAIKMLSDNAVPATLIIVGVADDVDSLIKEHASIERALEQVPMRRMDQQEIADIYSKGFGRVEIRPDVGATTLLVALPQGVPHFAHLLGQEVSRPAIMTGRTDIGIDDVKKAVEAACHGSDASMISAYVRATTSSHKTHFADVLLACALTDTDELGFFSPNDVRPALEKLWKEAVEQARYANHLVQFCEQRGPVLERRGGERRWRYRFINPMMRSYVVMRAYSDGVDPLLLDLTGYDPEKFGFLF